MTAQGLVSIGWVALDEEGQPLRMNKGTGFRKSPDGKPPRLYKTEAVAKRTSPVNQAQEVFLMTDEPKKKPYNHPTGAGL